MKNYEYIFKPFKFKLNTNHRIQYRFHFCLESEDSCMGRYGLLFSIRLQIHKLIIYVDIAPFGQIQLKR